MQVQIPFKNVEKEELTIYVEACRILRLAKLCTKVCVGCKIATSMTGIR